jgi:hypothetical protein
MAAVPLPIAKEARLEGSALSAYNVCLDFQSKAPDDDVIRARVLGYLILNAPSATAQHEVVKVIHSCKHDFRTLSELGETFINYFIRPCKSHQLSPVKGANVHIQLRNSRAERQPLLIILADVPSTKTRWILC